MRKTKYYIAYGSNLHVAQMQRRCPGAIAIGGGWLDGYRLEFRGSKTGAYATIVPDPESRVPIGVWRINDEHERALDIYEGYPDFYRKETVTVRVKRFGPEGRPAVNITGLVYIMDEAALPGIPSQRYVEVCSVGYRCFGLDQSPLIKAVSEARSLRRKAKEAAV